MPAVAHKTSSSSWKHRAPRSNPVRVRADVGVKIRHGDARFITFHGLDCSEEHFALKLGPSSKETVQLAPLVRIHSECITGDMFGSAHCDCGPQLDEALRRCKDEGGIVLYLRQEGRGIGLYNKLDAYQLQKAGADTFAANRNLGLPEDGRDFAVAASMLKAMGIRRIRLLTNNPEKADALRKAGIEVQEVLRTGVYVTDENRRYLEAKVRLANHTVAVGDSKDGDR